MTWQPIARAPKDGTNILVTSGGYNYAVVWWGDHDAADSEWGQTKHTPNFGWLFSDGHNDPLWYRAWPSLTHWMPLPEPPK